METIETIVHRRFFILRLGIASAQWGRGVGGSGGSHFYFFLPGLPGAGYFQVKEHCHATNGRTAFRMDRIRQISSGRRAKDKFLAC